MEERSAHISYGSTHAHRLRVGSIVQVARKKKKKKKKRGEKKKKEKKKEKERDPFFVYLLQGIMIVLRFISHVCLYGARGTTPGHVLGQSWQEGSSTEASTIVDSTENIDKM